LKTTPNPFSSLDVECLQNFVNVIGGYGHQNWYDFAPGFTHSSQQRPEHKVRRRAHEISKPRFRSFTSIGLIWDVADFLGGVARDNPQVSARIPRPKKSQKSDGSHAQKSLKNQTDPTPKTLKNQADPTRKASKIRRSSSFFDNSSFFRTTNGPFPACGKCPSTRSPVRNSVQGEKNHEFSWMAQGIQTMYKVPEFGIFHVFFQVYFSRCFSSVFFHVFFSSAFFHVFFFKVHFSTCFFMYRIWKIAGGGDLRPSDAVGNVAGLPDDPNGDAEGGWIFSGNPSGTIF